MSPSTPGASWRTAAPPTLAVEIASRRVTAVSLGSPRAPLVVTAHATESVPAGAVTPSLGEPNILDAEAVGAALGRCLSAVGRRSGQRVALIVPDSVARVSLIPLDTVPARAADLDQLVRWQLRKSTPFPIADARITTFVAHRAEQTTLAAVVSRKDTIDEYEAVARRAGLRPGIVDLASFSVINAVLGAPPVPEGDWLVVCLAAEATTLAVMRGEALMFYRHRATVDEEPLSALIHQTAMYHEDRLGTAEFSRVLICGAANAADSVRVDIEARLGVSVGPVEVLQTATVRDPGMAPDVVDAIAASVGMLAREAGAA